MPGFGRISWVFASVPSHFNWPIPVGNLVHLALGKELYCKGMGPVIHPGGMFGGDPVSVADVRRCWRKACRSDGDELHEERSL